MKAAISELSTLKNRGFLRSIDALAPVSWNDTRWTSTFHALNRYVTLHPMLRDNQNTPMEVHSKLLSSEEFEQLKALQERLNILYSTSEYLQSEKCDLAHARLLLDKIVERFRFVAGVEEKIGPEGALVVDPCFESAIVKVLNEEFRTLTTTEVQKLKPFEVPIASEHQSNKRRNEAEDIIEQESKRKRQKYIPLNHIPASSALVERSFSHADLIFEPRRRAMTPLHLELCLFLKFNRLLWEVEYLIEY